MTDTCTWMIKALLFCHFKQRFFLGMMHYPIPASTVCKCPCNSDTTYRIQSVCILNNHSLKAAWFGGLFPFNDTSLMIWHTDLIVS